MSEPQNGSTATFERVADIIAETADIPREKITPESHAIDDLGIDSLAFLDIAFAVDKAFGIERAASVDRAEATQPASPLERLRAGEIDVNGYADLKVEEATRGFAGLPAEDLAELKRALREQMTTDPDFVDLVRQATGGAPDPDLQARAYEALLRAVAERPWFEGVYWWKWFTDAGPDRDDFVPAGRAREVLAAWWAT